MKHDENLHIFRDEDDDQRRMTLVNNGDSLSVEMVFNLVGAEVAVTLNVKNEDLIRLRADLSTMIEAVQEDQRRHQEYLATQTRRK